VLYKEPAKQDCINVSLLIQIILPFILASSWWSCSASPSFSSAIFPN